MNCLTHLKYDCDIFCYDGNHLTTKALYLKTKTSLFIKCCYSWKKYLPKLKQHGLRDALSEEFSFKCLSVMIYEQFIVSIVMLSWHRHYYIIFITRESLGFSITFSSYKFMSCIDQKISQFLIFGNCDLSDVTSFSVERAPYHRRCPKISELRRFPFGDSLTQL